MKGALRSDSRALKVLMKYLHIVSKVEIKVKVVVLVAHTPFASRLQNGS